MGRPARERLERERPGPGVQDRGRAARRAAVRDSSIEKRASRTRSEVGPRGNRHAAREGARTKHAPGDVAQARTSPKNGPVHSLFDSDLQKEYDPFMPRSWRCLLALQTLLVVFGLSASSFAQTKMSAAILGLDSDDAERQADALSGALAHASPCPTRVDDQRKHRFDRAHHRRASLPTRIRMRRAKSTSASSSRPIDFFWGNVRRIGPDQLAAEVHYWQKGKPDSSVRRSFPDTAKDATDPGAKAAAAHIFEKLTGSTPLGGTLTVTAGNGEGAVLVDDEQKGALDHGVAHLDLAPGPHNVEVRSSGFMPSKQTVTVVAGNEAQVTMTLVPVAAPPDVPHQRRHATAAGHSPGHGKGRMIVGLALIGLGVIAEGVAGYEGCSSSRIVRRGTATQISTCDPGSPARHVDEHRHGRR